MIEYSNQSNMPISYFAVAFSRHMRGSVDGQNMLMHISNMKPSGAYFYDSNSRRYARNVGQMDAQGFCVVGYIKNGIVTQERVQYPNIINLSEVDFSLNVERGRYLAINEQRRKNNHFRAFRQ